MHNALAAGKKPEEPPKPVNPWDDLSLEQACAPLLADNYSFALTYDKEDPKIIPTSEKELQKIGKVHTPGGMIQGLTLADIKMVYKFDLDAIEVKRGVVCAVYKSIDLHLSLGDFRVLFNNKYPRGTCPYDVVLKHEYNHVEIFQDAVANIVAKMRSAIINHISTHNKFFGTKNTITHVTEIRLKQLVRPFINQLNHELNNRNNAIDTKENYAFEQAKCVDW